jgi:branched-chain amino acid aminotransferase
MVNAMSKIKFEIEKRKEKVILPETLVFGQLFTDHIFEVDYDEEFGGWHNPTIKKFGNIGLSPAAMVFHYGQALFEGLKAYKQESGRIALFRPQKNIERMNKSAKRICMPEIDPDLMLEALIELVRVDKDWIPTKQGYSLYIRPVMFASQALLGVHPSHNYKLIVMLSPVGPYYPEGFRPVPILATDKYVRAVRKGTGEAKVAGNYAASLLAQSEANKVGYSQVLWLDAIEQKNIEEVGAMNIFVQFRNEVATPALNGSILPGITRMSVIEILKEWGMIINERTISINEILDAYKNKELVEVFGTGTAAIISSVSKLKYNEHLLLFDETKAGELGTKLYEELLGIQIGKVTDRHNWMVYVD